MVGVETKRGCSRRCIYCADPVAKGKRIRTRPPEAVAEELRDLLAQGVSWLHLCDSEFNLPIWHAKELCRTIIEKGIGEKMSWYCYCSPTPFDKELADLMAKAGCTGINFGVDSLCNSQLKRLGRGHRLSHLEDLVHILKQSNLNFMFDLLVGGPGEAEESIRTTVSMVRRLDVPLVGMAIGVRVYPYTPLSEMASRGLLGERLRSCKPIDFVEPFFYVSPTLGGDAEGMVRHLCGNDSRFLFLAAPTEETSYNYVDDQALGEAIRLGARGAYWDILRKLRS